MYHVAICDDDSAFICYMKRLFLESEYSEEAFVFYEYHSGEELIEKIKNQVRCDLLILDMQLEGMDGNATAKLFRQMFSDSMLIFCSGVSLPTVESFETTPYRYWLKEYTEEHMKRELDSVLAKLESNRKSPFIMGKKGKNIVRLDARNVEYIEISKRGSKIHYATEQGEEVYSSEHKVAEFHEILEEFDFAYAHNSYIVNLEYVAAANATELELLDGKRLSISRSRAKEFRKLFACKLAQKY